MQDDENPSKRLRASSGSLSPSNMAVVFNDPDYSDVKLVIEPEVRPADQVIIIFHNLIVMVISNRFPSDGHREGRCPGSLREQGNPRRSVSVLSLSIFL